MSRISFRLVNNISSFTLTGDTEVHLLQSMPDTLQPDMSTPTSSIAPSSGGPAMLER